MSWIKEMRFPFASGTKSAAPDCFLGYVCSDIGLLRRNNEDNYLLGGHWNPDSADCSADGFSAPSGRFHLAAVFDGIGGGDAGEQASALAAKVFAEAEGRQRSRTAQGRMDQLMRGAFETANRCVRDLGKEGRSCGTTGTVLCTDGKKRKVFHLGDSRAYLFREGRLSLLTKDQTLAQMKMDQGTYDPGHPRAELERHSLTHYIGGGHTHDGLQIQESQWQSVFPGDKILLCSDGLYDMCTAEEMTRILSKSADLQAQTAALVQRAKHNGGADNITCMLIDFR